MEFLNQYASLKAGLDTRKQTVQESIDTTKTAISEILDNIASKKIEYKNTLNMDLLTQIDVLENQLNDNSKKLNTLNDILKSLELEKATYSGNINEEFHQYVQTETELNQIIEEVIEAKTDYISALNHLAAEMETIYNTSTKVKRFANEVLTTDQVRAIALVSPLTIGGLNEIIVTENKQDMLDINNARKLIKTFMARV